MRKAWTQLQSLLCNRCPTESKVVAETAAVRQVQARSTVKPLTTQRRRRKEELMQPSVSETRLQMPCATARQVTSMMF